jgi:ABC-type branched-subunit amino acid transport system substrate-binding protein
MRRSGMAAVGAACILTLVMSACGNDDSGGGGGRSGDGTLTVGVLSTLSGPASATFAAAPDAVRARFEAYEAEGGKCAGSLDFKVIEADDASGAQGALSGAQKLVQQDEVYALVEITPFFYGASQWLTTQGRDVPVLGGAWDGAQEWSDTDNNLFPAGSVPNYKKIYSSAGDYFAGQGGTVVAGVAYDSPSAQAGLETALQSAEAAGLKRGYVNNSLPFGTTDVGAVVLGIIDSGADVLNFGINPDTAFAIVAGLRQAGYEMKAIVAPTGYGADLLESAPAVQAGQGVTFTTSITPIEMATPATQRFSQALKDYAGSRSGVPSFSQIQAWLGADLLLHGLEVAGCDASQADFMTSLRQDKTWDGGGLYPRTLDLTTVDYDQQCSYYVKLEGETFVPVKDATPLCGGVVKG